MDGERFDAWARAIAVGAVSRRAAVRLVVGGAVGEALSWVGRTEAAAACTKLGKRCDNGDRCCGDGRCRGGRCRCRPGFGDCNGDRRCEDLRTSATDCGRCGNVCLGITLCRGGRCCLGQDAECDLEGGNDCCGGFRCREVLGRPQGRCCAEAGTPCPGGVDCTPGNPRCFGCCSGTCGADGRCSA